MEERYLNQRCHSILGEAIGISILEVGGIIGDLQIPPFKSPDLVLFPFLSEELY